MDEPCNEKACDWGCGRLPKYHVILNYKPLNPNTDPIVCYVCAYCVGSRRCRNNWKIIFEEEAAIHSVHCS